MGVSCGDALDKEIESSSYIYFFFVGPDICGFDIKKVHVILHFKNQYHSNKKSIRCKVNAFVFKSVIVLTLNDNLNLEKIVLILKYLTESGTDLSSTPLPLGFQFNRLIRDTYIPR